MANTDLVTPDQYAELRDQLVKLRDRVNQFEFKATTRIDGHDAEIAIGVRRVDALTESVRELSQAFGQLSRWKDGIAQSISAFEATLRATSTAFDRVSVDVQTTRALVADLRTEMTNSMRGVIADLRAEFKLELDDAMQSLVSQGGFAGRFARAVRAAWQELR